MRKFTHKKLLDTKKITFLIFTLLLCLFTSCDNREVDWTPTFDSTDKIPYGTYILHKELIKIFPHIKRKTIGENLESYLPAQEAGNYIHIYPYVYYDPVDWSSLQEYIYIKGGTALLSFQDIDSLAKKELGIEVDAIAPLTKRPNISLTVEKAGIYAIPIDHGVSGYYFSKMPKNSTVLGYGIINGKKRPNFIQVQHGNGQYLLHLEPYSFTNFHLLQGKEYEYAAAVLSYLDNKDIYWDNHGINSRENKTHRSNPALSFILENPSLAWAFWLLIILAILFLLFNYKRKERSVPLYRPLANSSLEFAKTLSFLLASEKNHKILALKKITYFGDQLRRHYYLDPQNWHIEFAKQLSHKTQTDIEICNKLIHKIIQIKKNDFCTRKDFFALQNLIQEFREKNKLYE